MQFNPSTYAVENDVDKIKKIGRRAALEIISDFEAGSGWDAGVADTTTYQHGSQGIKLTSADAAVSSMSKTCSFNCRNKIFFLNFYVDDVSKLTEVDLYIQITNDWAKYISLGLYGEYPHDRHIQTGWNRVTVFYPNFLVTGSPTQKDLETCVGVRLRVKSTAGNTVNVTFDMLGMIENPATKGMVAVTFDDGLSSLETYARPIMSKYNIPGVAYIPTSTVGGVGKATLAQLLTLQDLGWDIASHSHTHSTSDMRTLAIGDFTTELTDSIAWLKANGFWRGLDHFAYPGGDNNLAMRNEVLKYFKTGRSTQISGGYMEASIINDMSRLRLVYIIGVTTYEQIKAKIDAAIAHNGFLILLFHDIIDGAPGTNDTTLTIFTQIIDYLNIVRNDIDIVTMTEAYKRLEQYQAIF